MRRMEDLLYELSVVGVFPSGGGGGGGGGDGMDEVKEGMGDDAIVPLEAIEGI